MSVSLFYIDQHAKINIAECAGVVHPTKTQAATIKR